MGRVIILGVFMAGWLAATCQNEYGMVEQDLPKGLLRGEMVPDFTAITCQDKQVQLSAIFEDGPVVVIFYRGAWNAHCQQHLRQVSDSLDLLYDAGLQIIAVTPESPRHACSVHDALNVQFDVVSDVGGTLMRKFDVDYQMSTTYAQQIMAQTGIDVAKQNDAETATLPVTATYVISHNQEVFWVHFNYDQTRRAGVLTILNAVKPRY